MNKDLKRHRNRQSAITETKIAGITAVRIDTFVGEKKVSTDYYSYRSTKEFPDPDELYEDFPLAIASNQSIAELDPND